MVRVWEPNPPAGCEAVEWLLLTTEAVEQPSDAWLIVSWYECRWMVEEFHKAKKTGCNIEELQFASIKGLEPTIALLSVVATTLLNLAPGARSPEAKTIAATDIVDASYVAVCSACGVAGWRRNATSRSRNSSTHWLASADTRIANAMASRVGSSSGAAGPSWNCFTLGMKFVGKLKSSRSPLARITISCKISAPRGLIMVEAWDSAASDHRMVQCLAGWE